MPAGSANGQSSELQAYWKALSDAPTIESLSVVPKPAAGAAAEEHIADGLYRLRKYEMTTDRTDALIAIRDLTRAVEKDPDNAWAHYALGVALARGSDMRQRPYAQRSSYKPGIYSLAAAHAPDELLRALELDPTLEGAVIEFAYVAIDLTSVPLMKQAREMLSTEARRGDVRAVFMTAQLENRLGDHQAALEQTATAESLGFDRSGAAIERVIALAAGKAPDSLVAATYFAGVDMLTDAGSERYFAGLVQLSRKKEIDAWRNAGLQARRTLIRDFWRTRAALAGAPVDRQITQLYRKYAAAYRIPGMSVLGGRPEEPHRITLLGKIFPRVKVGDELPTMDVERAAISPEALEYKPAYAKRIAFAWEVLQFRQGPAGGSQVMAGVQILHRSVPTLLDTAGTVDANISIALLDTATNATAHETNRALYTVNALGERAALLFGVSVSAPAVPHALVRVTVENAMGTAGAIAKGTLDIQRFDPDSLTMSDIVLSPPDAAGYFERGDVHVSLAPGRTFTPDEVPTLYYEVYGLRSGETYSTAIDVEKIDTNAWSSLKKMVGSGTQDIRLSFQDVATVSPLYGVQQTRKLGIASLKPGVYRLRITITDSRGRKQIREKEVEIIKPQ
jgi:tetratricopeptide (TPR) repeat protein